MWSAGLVCGEHAYQPPGAQGWGEAAEAVEPRDLDSTGSAVSRCVGGQGHLQHHSTSRPVPVCQQCRAPANEGLGFRESGRSRVARAGQRGKQCPTTADLPVSQSQPPRRRAGVCWVCVTLLDGQNLGSEQRLMNVR